MSSPADPTPFAAAAARVASGGDHHVEAAALVEAMSLDEKLGCLDGDTDFWSGMLDMTSGGYHRHPWPAAVVERLGVPGINFVDGPHGSVVGPATCFPVSMARGATFDPDLEERVGAIVGAEMRAVGGTYTGAVCINLLRHPAWGRAQETYGEDPHHVGEMGAAFTHGLQRHVLACMKHFACNSMENARFTVDVTADDRSLHEVYLPHFRRVAEEGVASVMSAYNSLNGQWCGDSPALLDGVLRDEWDWDGFVITDFMFGLRDPVASVAAGCAEIEMPFRQQREQVLGDAVADGRLDEATVDRAVTRIVATLLRFADLFTAQPDASTLAAPDSRSLAHEVAVASTVLLANDGALPIDVSTLTKVAVLGRLAAVPNLGDGGSSNVFPPEVTTPLDGLRAALDAEVVHADGSVAITEGADVVVVVVGTTKHDEGEYISGDMSDLIALFPPPPEAGLPSRTERPEEPSEAVADDRPTGDPSEGFAPGGDRRSLRLSLADEALILEAREATEAPVVVVVMGGSAFVMPWLESVSAAVQLWYPGMEGGHALADVLTGTAEPGGRLPFAVPRDEDDLVHFDPDASEETYGLFHGQWHLDRADVAAHLPFGHGLGYTTFAVADDLDVRGDQARVSVTNVGERAGSTVVFAYAGVPDSAFERPRRRLIGFGRVRLEAGASISFTIDLDWRQLDVRADGAWTTEPGEYVIDVGFHANDPASATTTVLR